MHEILWLILDETCHRALGFIANRLKEMQSLKFAMPIQLNNHYFPFSSI